MHFGKIFYTLEFQITILTYKINIITNLIIVRVATTNIKTFLCFFCWLIYSYKMQMNLNERTQTVRVLGNPAVSKVVWYGTFDTITTDWVATFLWFIVKMGELRMYLMFLKIRILVTNRQGALYKTTVGLHTHHTRWNATFNEQQA